MSMQAYRFSSLKVDWYNDRRVRLLRELENGDTYSIIFLKLLLSAQTDETGYLTCEGFCVSYAEELAIMIDEATKDVEITVSYLIEVGLLQEGELLEDGSFIPLNNKVQRGDD